MFAGFARSAAFGAAALAAVAAYPATPIAAASSDDGSPLTAEGVDLAAVTGQPYDGPVARILDPDPTARAQDYAVAIAWGDGTTSDGVVRRSVRGRALEVRGRHTYLFAGRRSAAITVTDRLTGVQASATTAVQVLAYHPPGRRPS